MASSTIQRVKGTRDFYPEDWAYQKWLSNTCISLAKGFGYQEYEGPILEPMDLYLGKSSEEIVTQQTFTVADRDGKQLVLRPELTPTLARMIAQKEGELAFPVRWQSYGCFFRYERPQRGRGRAFYQWNIDLLGSEQATADAELITIACNLLKSLGLTPEHATVRINDRQGLEQHLVGQLGLTQDQVRPLFSVIDRIDKVDADRFRAQLCDLGLSAAQIDLLLGRLEDPDPSFSPWLQQIVSLVEQSGAGDYVQVDPKIVRGFDYYTSTVFEAWAKTSLRRAIFGGGRYDNLTLQVGGKKQVPGVGFAVGDMALAELLKEVNLAPVLPGTAPDLYVTVFSEELLAQSIAFAREIRNRGLAVELALEPGRRLDRQFKHADRKGIAYVAVLGPDEIERGVVVLKNLTTRSQVELDMQDLDAVVTHLKATPGQTA
ncbi:MAG: histidine--tRNA ligase [bacterium]|nr:histidine--tRNA ligase [bacterium]